MFFVSNTFLRGMRVSYRISGYSFRYFSTQHFFQSNNAITEHYNHDKRYAVSNHFDKQLISCYKIGNDRINRNAELRTAIKNISDSNHRMLEEKYMFFKSKNRNYESHGKNVMRLSALLGLSFFSSKEEGKEEKESELIIMIKRGILALKNGELNKAEQLLHVALKTAQESQNEKAVTYIFDLLANLAYQREEYSKAENLFKEVLKRLLKDGMPEDDNAIVEISLKLASVFASKRDYEKAVEGFHFCIATQEKKIKEIGEQNLDEDTLLLWAMSMDWYARFLLSIQKYEMAKLHFIKAYEMSERLKGPEHTQTAVLLNDIGSVCSLQKNYAEAIQYLERAIEAARISKSEDIASFYVNLGAVYLQQEMLSSAEKYCKEGLTLARQMKNEEAIDEAKSCLTEVHALKNKK